MKQELKKHICKTSLCKEYKTSESKIVASMKGRKYELENDSNELISKFDIDDCVFENHNIPNFKLCDNIVIVYNEKNGVYVENIYIWIELKGADLNQACLQILNSFQNAVLFNKNINHFARIILSKTNTVDFRKDAYKQLKRIFKENLDHKNINYQEKITKLI
jgi:hypothetical protein